jgi:glycolate oxidase FAD binding subunit
VALFNRAARQPLPVSATSWYGGCARIRLSGAAAAVEAACNTLGGEPVEADGAGSWWNGLRHHRVPALARRTPLWRVVVPATAASLPIDGLQLIEWAGALRWLRTDTDGAAVRACARAAGGAAALWYGPPGTRMFDELPPAALAIQRRLKAGFDPAAIFNRGRLDPGL